MTRPPIYQAPSEGVRPREFFRGNITPSLRSHGYELGRNKEKLAHEGSLTVLLRRCKSLVMDRSSRVGQAKGHAPFYSAAPPIISRLTHDFTLLPDMPVS
jgi:hypothetical protein